MSPNATTSEDEASLRDLVIEAIPRVDVVPPPKSTIRSIGKETPSAEPEAMPAYLRPILEGIEALNRAHNENALRLNRIENRLGMNGELHDQVNQMLNEARVALDQRNSINRTMFEALHTELKGYKDAFMLDAVLRPVIRDLIALYDDIVEIHRQIKASVSAQTARGGASGGGLVLLENVQVMGSNIEHNVHFILEVLERMDVTLLPENTGKLDKRTQRAVAVEAADAPEQDQNIVKLVKRGFVCKDRVIRPEEVVIQKWKEGCLVALEKPAAPNSQRPK